MAGADDENLPPPVVTLTQQAPHTVSAIKLPILKKDTNGQIKVLPPKTAKEILAREKERKVRTTLLMAIPEDHLAKFHKMTDAKEMWEAIKSRFSGNDESKKMHKYILKQQFEGFSVSNSEGLHKGYDRFQSLQSQLEIHGAGVSTEDANQKFLRSLPSSWSQVAMISMRLKKFYKKTGRKLQFDAKEPIGFDKTKVECFNCHKTWHFARDCRSKGNQDIGRRDAGNTGYKAKDNRRRPGKQENPKALLTLDGYGVDRTCHAKDKQENFALMAYSHSGSDTKVTSCSKECEESYSKLKKLYDEHKEQLGDASMEIKAYTLALAKKLLAEAVKEKEELKTKLEKWQNSSKSLNKLLDSHMSVKEKIGLCFSEQVKENELYDEALMSVFDNHSSDVEDAHVYDRFAKVEGMHAVPPPMIGNYMPPKSDFGIDESHVETLESVPELVVIEPKVVSQPKVWSNAPIIEKYESDSDDEYVSHKVDKRDWNGLMSKKLGLGYRFTRKACFVCGSFGHLIRDCDFHEKRMAKQVELNKKKSKGTGQGENRPVWNNVQRLNHQNKFVPTTVLIRIGRFPVNTARHNFNSQAVSTSAARKANVVQPIVNDVRPRPIFNKNHSPIRRPFNRTTHPLIHLSKRLHTWKWGRTESTKWN
ncbi:ribonuclease H-like domain-containing protein [Tanacetum coccineum]